MRAVALLLVAVMVAEATGASTKCAVADGHKLKQFGGRDLKLKVPCKYNAIHQKCGNYQVTVTPGNLYMFPTYITHSIWLSVQNVSTELFWEGRTTNKLAALYIVHGGKDRVPFNKRGGTLEMQELLETSHTSHDITVKEKNGAFSLTFGPFDFNGNLAKDSRMEFECFAENTPTPYPEQYCGSSDGAEIKIRTRKLFKNKKRVEWTVLYDIFTDASIAQIDPLCVETTQIMTKTCKKKAKRIEAIKTCHLILDSDGHTQCVFRSECNPMEVFKNCVQYVCSDYEDKVACEDVGRAIDMCRVFPLLTPRIKEANCYKDFMTSEDNPYYNTTRTRVFHM